MCAVVENLIKGLVDVRGQRSTTGRQVGEITGRQPGTKITTGPRQALSESEAARE